MPAHSYPTACLFLSDYFCFLFSSLLTRTSSPSITAAHLFHLCIYILYYICNIITVPWTNIVPHRDKPLPNKHESRSSMRASTSRNPPPSLPPPTSNGSRLQNHLATEMKSRAPLAVPPGTQPLENGHSRNLSSGFEMTARSPPNQSSKTSSPPCSSVVDFCLNDHPAPFVPGIYSSYSFPYRSALLSNHSQIPNMFPANSSARELARPDQLVHFYIPQMLPLITRPASILQRYHLSLPRPTFDFQGNMRLITPLRTTGKLQVRGQVCPGAYSSRRATGQSTESWPWTDWASSEPGWPCQSAGVHEPGFRFDKLCALATADERPRPSLCASSPSSRRIRRVACAAASSI